MEPFTTLSIQLQGGKFDHADRMFSDIGGTWNGVIEDMSDVKELVRIFLSISFWNLFIKIYSYQSFQLRFYDNHVTLPPSRPYHLN